MEAIAAIRRHGLSESDSSRRALDEFRQATDPLAVWLDRYTILHSDAVIPQDHLYREYGRNCSDAGRPTIIKTAFGRATKKLRLTAGDYQRTATVCRFGVTQASASSPRRTDDSRGSHGSRGLPYLVLHYQSRDPNGVEEAGRANRKWRTR